MRSDRRYQVVDGQTDFSGGMRMVGDLASNEYRFGKNIIIRNGDVETRPGFRRKFSINQSGFKESFYFNEDNARYNDSTHTGYWFPWGFIGSAWGNIQGISFFKFEGETESRLIIVSDGSVFIQKDGFVEEITTSETIATTETVVFVQGKNELIMFRSDNNNPLRMLASDEVSGFVSFTSPGTTNRIPTGDNGSAFFGRLWVISGDNIYASDSLDYDNYDYVYQNFDIEAGDSDKLVQMIPFKENYAICFKQQKCFLLKGLNHSVLTGTTLDQYVDVDIISTKIGMVGKYAYAEAGEQIYFLSFRGVESMQRVEQGRVMGLDVPLSAPINPIIKRINKNYIQNSCAISFDNYLLFSVPVDDSVVNNMTLVYDFLANNGRGAWISTWESQTLTPIRYFIENETLYCLNSDGALKVMFSDDPWDSEDVTDDVQAYDSNTAYEKGDLVLDTTFSANVIYKAKRLNLGVELSNTTYWEQITDTLNLFNIESEVQTRFYKHGDDVSPKKYGRCQLNFLNQNPKISVDIETEDFQSKQTIFSDITYSRTQYEAVSSPHDWTNWNDFNWNFDFNTPYREDYTVLLDTAGTQWTINELATAFTMQDITNLAIPANGIIDGMFMDLDGIYLNIWTPHTLRFIPRVLKNIGYSLIIKNTQGKFKLNSIISVAQQSYFAKKDR